MEPEAAGEAAPARSFDDATAISALGGGRFEAQIDAGWSTPIAANGGYLAAILVRAIQAHVARVRKERSVRTFACARVQNVSAGRQLAGRGGEMFQKFSVKRIDPTQDEGGDQRLDQLPKFRFKHARALHQAPGGKDKVFGLEAFVCTVATVLDFLAKLGRLKIVPQTIEIPIIGLEISHRLEELAERDVAVGVDHAAHVARIARDVLRMTLHFLHVIAVEHEPAHRGGPAADAPPAAVKIAPAELQLKF